ncbi:Rpn family recombination-promoting nuclease/putative transposase [Kluyvera genomosp. 3]|uniref:Rpn family recombination-promoting nuclease/putative transposase n=1 Tax=Kluyvera genomosp. 3 TaxID=2774055 RepID=A0A6G9RQ58_9ENTR|nr:Rpn family recombination-promoting nuclease/putative transposase [Kluyvera genomosp. 3]QIR28962.1 Rpn family recombination-promoting nuclease/putative transposase [Kluyvera genomosp. 3]
MRKNRTPTPHDLVFKTFLSTMETARDFIAIHLPPALLQLCDLQTLQLESGSFIEEDLHPYFSDMLYSLKTACGDGYIHVLIEHQSSPDRHMAFRLMRYAIAAMQRHLEAGHNALPLVIPILFYQGRRSPYPNSMNWLDEFSDPVVAGRIYSQNFPLVDITVIPDDEIMRHRSMAALTLIQKHIRQRDLTRLLDKLDILLTRNHISGQQVIALVNYMLQAGEAQDARTLLYEMAQRAPQYGDELMTLAEQLKQEGRNEGIQQGMQQGIQTGEREASRKIARAMLEKGIPAADIIEMTGVSAEELPSLQH